MSISEALNKLRARKSFINQFTSELFMVNSVQKETTTIMDFWGRKKSLSFGPSAISNLKLLCFQFVAFILLTLYRWSQIHNLKKSSTYFIDVWLENLFVLILIYLFTRKSNIQVSGGKTFNILRHTICLHLFLTMVYCIDFITFTKKSSGTEFYQYSMALSVPILLVVLNQFCVTEIPSSMNYIAGLLASWKLMILFHDPEFDLSFYGSLFGVFVSVSHGVYLLLLKDKLEQVTVVEMVFMFSLSTVCMLPIFIVAQYYTPSVHDVLSGLVFKNLLKLLSMALLKIASFSAVLVLLKHSDPVTALVTINVAYIPDKFVQALIYKRDCTLSATKVCIINGIDFFVVFIQHLFRSNSPIIAEGR